MPHDISDGEHLEDDLVEEDGNPYNIDDIPDVDTEEGDGLPDDWDPDCIPPRPDRDAGSKTGERAFASRPQKIADMPASGGDNTGPASASAMD